MSWWEAIILGIVQGLTEFFPVSSSGHLVIVQRVLGIRLPGVTFEIVVHVATMVSVVVVYREKLMALARGCLGLSDEAAWPYLMKLVLATLPAVVLVLALGDWVEARFDDPAFTGAMLLVTGSFLWSTRWARDLAPISVRELLPVAGAGLTALLLGVGWAFAAVVAIQVVVMGGSRITAPAEWTKEPGWAGALAMGIAQSTALLPGISRAGSTVVTGLWRRIDPVQAAEFSFLMSLIAITGAAVRQAPAVAAAGFDVGAVPLVLGFVAAAVSGVLAIRFFVAMLRRQSFSYFAWYCWAVGIFFLLLIRP